MSRRFDAVDDEFRVPVQASSNFTGAFTLIQVIKFRNAANWHGFLSHVTSAPAIAIACEKSGTTGDVFLGIGAGDTQLAPPEAINTTDWVVWCFTKASGTVVPVFHWKNLTDDSAWTHANMDSAEANASSHSGGSIRFGEWLDSDDADCNLAIDAGWGSVLTNPQIEGLFANSRTQDFLDLHSTVPGAYCHQHNQATATEDIEDLFGNAHTASGTITSTTDTSGIQGTAMEADDPPDWLYFGASTRVMTDTFQAIPFITRI